MAMIQYDQDLALEYLNVGLADGALQIAGIDGAETISSPYDFDLEIVCTEPDGLAPETIDELLTARVRIPLDVISAQPRSVWGVISRVEFIGFTDDAPGGDSFARYYIEVVPRFWRTRLTHRSRCFVETSFPDVLRLVLAEYGLTESVDFELRLLDEVNDYDSRPDRMIVQFEESDFAFLSRWMERLGMSYFFEQDHDRERMVITDDNSKLAPAPAHAQVTLHPGLGNLSPGQITDLRRVTSAQPRNVHVRDFSHRDGKYERSQMLGANAQIDPQHAGAPFGIQAHYGDDHPVDEGSLKRAAMIRAESWTCRKRIYSARSVNVDWAPGQTFELRDTGVGELDIHYVITSVTHRFGEGTPYTNAIEAVERDLANYRPRRTTPWPRIEGVVPARIDDARADPASTAPVDDYGRYRVVIPYDAYGTFGQTPAATAWIRKAEPYAGPRHGAHFTLHSGAEVLLAHVNGDPDRPVIVGAMPNAANPSPVTLREPTRSAIRTRSGILFDFEDDAR